MTALTVMPDQVQLAIAALNDCSEVAALVGNRIASSSPKDTTKPWLRVSPVGGARSLSAPMRLARRNIQVDGFAPATPSTQPLSGDVGAMKLARVAEAALFAAAGFANEDGVITKVEQTLGPASQPDTSRTPPTPRVHFTLAITVRPT
jgi:hypothetical protein